MISLRAEVRSRLPERLAELLAPNRIRYALLCCLRTRQPIRFAFRELLVPLVPARRGAVCKYTLRGSGLDFCFRHGTVDIGVLAEVFRLRYYDLPPAAARRLSRVESPRVLDLGAHVGLFALSALEQLPAAEIVGYEPDPMNHRVLQCAIRSNSLSGRWKTREACATARDGEVAFVGGLSSGSRVALAGSSGPGTLAVQALDVLPEIGWADLLKMDMEGSEWEILTDPRFGDAAPPVIALEYHPHLCPELPARDFARRTLVSLGYDLEDVFHDAATDVGMLWAVRPPEASSAAGEARAAFSGG